MVNTKVDINLAAIQIMWLLLLMRISLINQNVWMILELVGCILCTTYVITNIKYIRVNALSLVIMFATSYLISAIANRQYNGLLITYTGIKFAWKIVLYFTVPWIAIKKRGSKSVARASWRCLRWYWIPSIVTVFIQGRDVVDNANDTYFIGNKFNVAYLNVIMLCLMLFLNAEQISMSKPRLILKVNNKKLKAVMMYALAIYTDLYMKAYTGLFMILFMLALSMLSRVMRFRFNKKWSGFIKLIEEPAVLTISIILSGIATTILGVAMNIPKIASYLASIGKTGNILSRTLIYKNLAEIISKKPWIGYGFGSAIVSRYFGPNAQNGLAQVMIYVGILGTLLMLMIAFYCCRCGGAKPKPAFCRNPLCNLCICALCNGRNYI